ncbi:DUF5672 family protein [Flavobacterium fluviale]|uniref:DUF5672 domain-containing protein n=1 Tax=Flavobacterium fluviale TaxID=2249356 RepID=A0A344LN69_9FLAO|nr:DUF5672 family protein [Flavobacterium fluviale]AXB55361.1 hypothetical protein HYN86_01575 [Flavobacterium fluviale]
MEKNQICIVIPIYKEELNLSETKSVLQCLKVLSDYSIYFIAPEGLKIEFYEKKFSEIPKTIFFDKNYFESLKGYNKLMLNSEFYKTFDTFSYMLVYQTDCYVFRDELLMWAKKGFDYIGGIWFEGFVGNPYLGAKMWKAGNGGFSLRKIDSAIKILSSKKTIKNFRELFQEKKKMMNVSRVQLIRELFFLPLYVIGYKNNYSYCANNYEFNEDFYFIEMYERNKIFKMPLIGEALTFSWDRHPSYMYEQTNDTPFGCHAWFREDFPYEANKKFWLKKII